MRVKVLVRTGLLNAAPHALVGYGDEPSHSRPPHTYQTDPDCGPVPFDLGMPRTPERAYLTLARAMVIQALDTVLASPVSH